MRSLLWNTLVVVILMMMIHFSAASSKTQNVSQSNLSFNLWKICFLFSIDYFFHFFFFPTFIAINQVWHSTNAHGNCVAVRGGEGARRRRSILCFMSYYIVFRITFHSTHPAFQISSAPPQSQPFFYTCSSHQLCLGDILIPFPLPKVLKKETELRKNKKQREMNILLFSKFPPL